MNKKYKENFLHAGSIARQVRAYGKSLIIKGASYNKTISKIKEKIFEFGAYPAFPPQIALNEIAAHFLLSPGEELIFTDQLVKLDIGVCYKGAIGDCAVSIDLSGKYQNLIDAAEMALLNAEQSIRVGQPIREIGRIIEEAISSFGLKPIKNLSGHGLAPYRIHAEPSFPNYDDLSKEAIKPGMTFAIEPFATDGGGFIYEMGEPKIFSLCDPHQARTKKARSLINRIKDFHNLPFAMHDVLREDWPVIDVKACLLELLNAGAIIGYPPLVETKGGFVAQAENSVLVDDNGGVFITTR